MRFWKDERGQMVPMVALSITTLMGFMALAIDVGVLFHVRREVQIAADAAAAAGAVDFRYNGSAASATTAARAAALQNGVANGSNGTVQVNMVLGSAYGSPRGAGFVQTVVTVPNPTFFMKLFRINRVNVVASAVAGPGFSPGCVWTLGVSGTDIGGSGSLSIPGCEVYDDSSSGSAISLTGSLNAAKVGVTGGVSGTVTPTPITGMIPVRDPLASLPAPGAPGGPCTGPFTWASGSHPLSPGCYNGVSISGGTLILSPGNYRINGSLNVTGSANATFGSGDYTITGNLTLAGTGTKNGTNVMFYTGGATTVGPAGTLNLTAPTSGAENGILIFQARGNTNTMMIGASTMNVQGIIYAPNGHLALTGAGFGTMSTDLVADTLNLSGSTTFQNYGTINSTSPITKIVMVQ